MKITGYTVPEGEDVIALEVGDSIWAPSIYPSGGVGASTPAFEFVKIKKLKAGSTNELFKRSVLGTGLLDVTFEFYDNAQVMFYQITLKFVTVNHFSWLSPECANCGKLYHEVWFDYRQIEVTDIATGNVVRFNRQTKSTY
jgi:type VI protein secretion system component Hcp